MLIITFLLFIAFCFFQADRDAAAYLLKDKNDYPNTLKWIKKWHRDGFIIYLLYTFVLAWLNQSYLEVFSLALFVRLGLFDIFFNNQAGLPLYYIGATATADKFFSKIFGPNGGKLKAIIFTLVAIVLLIIFFIK